EMLLHGEAPPPALVTRLLAREELAEIDRPHPRPDAAGRAKIRDAAFCGYSRSREGNDASRVIDQLVQMCDCLVKIAGDHCYILRTWPAIPAAAEATRSPCEFSTQCCASAISMRPLRSMSNSSGSRRCAAARTPRADSRW